MKTRHKIIFSLISALIIFAVCIALAVMELFPSYSSFVERVFLSYPKVASCFILAAAFSIVFFIFFLLFSITKKHHPVIKKRIEKEQLASMKELMDVADNYKLSQLLEMLDNRKALLTYELKNKYCNHSIKYIKYIDEQIKSSFSEIEEAVRAKKKSEAVEDYVEELKTPDDLNPEEIIGELETLETGVDSLQEDMDLIEELDNAETSVFLEDFEDAEDLEEADDELETADEVEEIEEIPDDDTEEPEIIEELEVVEAKDPYPELLNALNHKPIYVASSNKTFISAASDDFATADNVFAEDLCIGTEYVHKYAPFDDTFVFNPVKLDFVEDEPVEVLLPVENEKPFTMTKFAEGKDVIAELPSAQEDTIIEKDGIYTISEKVSCENFSLDPSLKSLVDSILR